MDLSWQTRTSWGVSVQVTELEETRALAEADPNVKAGNLTVEAIPWMAVSGDPKP